MIPALLVFIYLGIVLYIGIFAFRRGKATGEDFFLANRGLKPVVFLLTMFGSNMTAFAILGSSGLAYRRGIGVYGLMASASAFVIPLSMFFIGTRLWYVGKRFGHMTQVQYFRDRWESSSLGTLIFALTAVMLVPYIIIGVMGGGTTLEAISTTTGPNGQVSHFVSYEVGGLIVAVVVMGYVFFGGMQGTAWVNTFQTTLFLIFGAVAFVILGQKLGGFHEVMVKLLQNKTTAPLITRERIPPGEFLSYMLIPFSSIMFPHIAITSFSAEKVTHFKRTVIWYPICIMAIWLPSVYLGVVAAQQFPGLKQGETDDVILRLLATYTGSVTSGLLGAGIMACVMASDSQILALCTMFSEDVFAHYGGKKRFGDAAQVWTGRAFIVGITIFAYAVALALKHQEGIFELAIRFAFSGYAALTPVMVAALFWKRSTKFGAYAATIWVTVTMLATWWMTQSVAAPKPGAPLVAIFASLGHMFLRTPSGVTFYDYLPVLPMFVGSALLMVGVSLLTAPPTQATLDRYFPPSVPTAPPVAARAA